MLMLAWLKGHERLTVLLLARGAALNLQHNSGGTALHMAAFNGHCAIVRRLLRAGARTNLSDDATGTPLAVAEVRGHSAVARLLRNSARRIQTRCPCACQRWGRRDALP